MEKPKLELETKLFESPLDWVQWLESHHESSSGLWLRFAKKTSSLQSITYAQALEDALCYGWIDGQKKSCDEDSWLQKFTPRRPKSIWSEVNREKVTRLIESGRMKVAGHREVEKAKADGRWEAAYAPMSTSQIPSDFQEELDKNPAAKAFFETLTGSNRYAILFRIHTAKKPETRARRIAQFIAMLEKSEKIHS